MALLDDELDVPLVDAAALTAELASELSELLLLVPLAEDWACRAAIRLCMNCWKAVAAELASEELVEEVPEVEEEEVEEVLLEDESVPVVLDELLTAPLDSRACMIAAMRPPPGAGAALVELVALLSLLELLD